MIGYILHLALISVFYKSLPFEHRFLSNDLEGHVNITIVLQCTSLAISTICNISLFV
mgnify:CR=1 FL=1